MVRIISFSLQSREIHVHETVVFGIVDILMAMRFAFPDDFAVLRRHQPRERDGRPLARVKRARRKDQRIFVLPIEKRIAKVDVHVEHLAVKDDQIELVSLRELGDDP